MATGERGHGRPERDQTALDKGTERGKQEWDGRPSPVPTRCDPGSPRGGCCSGDGGRRDKPGGEFPLVRARPMRNGEDSRRGGARQGNR